MYFSGLFSFSGLAGLSAAGGGGLASPAADLESSWAWEGSEGEVEVEYCGFFGLKRRRRAAIFFFFFFSQWR